MLPYSYNVKSINLFFYSDSLIEECWDPEPVVRPTFSEIIVRLDKIVANFSKQGWLKDTFKLPWYVLLFANMLNVMSGIFCNEYGLNHKLIDK